MIEWQIPCHKLYSGNWVPLIYPHLLFRDCSCVVEDLRVEQSSSHKKVLNIYMDVHLNIKNKLGDLKIAIIQSNLVIALLPNSISLPYFLNYYPGTKIATL